MVRVSGRRDRYLPKWYGRGIPLRYAGLPFEGEVILHISHSKVIWIYLVVRYYVKFFLKDY